MIKKIVHGASLVLMIGGIGMLAGDAGISRYGCLVALIGFAGFAFTDFADDDEDEDEWRKWHGKI